MRNCTQRQSTLEGPRPSESAFVAEMRRRLDWQAAALAAMTVRVERLEEQMLS